MGWILLLSIIGTHQGSMTGLVFSDEKSCVIAGDKLTEALDKNASTFKRKITFQCVSVKGLR